MQHSRVIISAQNLSRHFGSAMAVDNVSLDIMDGEFLALLGPSGCGKTTFLRMLGGFENPTSGCVIMDGEDITHLPPNKRHLNMVFQSYAVFPHMNVRDNVGYGLRMDKTEKSEMQRRVDEALELVRMDSFATRMPDQLSGGQRQRVALARALVKRPRVLLLDEPLSALDAKLREAMQLELVNLQNTVGITFVVVTHDQDEALSMAGRVAVMESGMIRQLDTPRNLYEAPCSRFVADFVGRMNIIAARRISDNVYEATGLGKVRASANNDNAQYVAIRPEKITVTESAESANGTAAKNAFVAVIRSVSYYGGGTVLSAQTESGAILTAAILNANRGAQSLKIGDKINLSWRAEDMITLAE